ncbi:hypothetical protein [Streptomyces cyanogenus]|uniref:Uncharacterized protein n=1 Tax=Streptomyces cyanogenus TaxID=80860 RepID=A0ABX7TXL5_STRCY|nr:hypothetical protein [Streptomyces cyanogenus]QTE01523.1 hypothetical protein S1361_29615 [Streptomyces cyanogenus]
MVDSRAAQGRSHAARGVVAVEIKKVVVREDQAGTTRRPAILEKRPTR